MPDTDTAAPAAMLDLTDAELPLMRRVLEDARFNNNYSGNDSDALLAIYRRLPDPSAAPALAEG